MAAMGDKTEALETSPSDSEPSYHLPQPNTENQTQTPKMSLYEQSREERIKANLQRMHQLGLKDLSNSLLNSNPHFSSRRGRARQGSKPPATPLSPLSPPSAPTRRSSRLQNTTPVSYSEVVLAKKDELFDDFEQKLKNTEVYTEEHEKLLGNTERSWTLFVDGYGRDGRRIYDPVKGKTCHQCRQKTLGHRTHCSKCSMVQGQFCGDCLYMRYGEHVLEALENPNWVCPVCRGICNCSLCRQAKGWAPTGSLYRKISQMGFKSVAHYLIKTRREQTSIKRNPDTCDQVSAKKSLSFSDVEVPSEESLRTDHNQLVTSKTQSEGDGMNSDKKESNAYPKANPTIIHEDCARKPFLISESELEFGKGNLIGINPDIHRQPGFLEADAGKKRDDEFVCEFVNESHFTHKEPNDSPVTLDGGPATTDSCSVQQSSDSIAGRLSQRCGEHSSHCGETMEADGKVLGVQKTENHQVSGKKTIKAKEAHNADKNVVEGHIISESTQKIKKRPKSAMEQHSPESIAGRLKQRRKQSKDLDEQVSLRPNETVSEAKLAVKNPSSGTDCEANLKINASGTNMDCITRKLRPRNKAV